MTEYGLAVIIKKMILRKKVFGSTEYRELYNNGENKNDFFLHQLR